MQLIISHKKGKFDFRIVNYTHDYKIGQTSQFGFYVIAILEYCSISKMFVKKDTKLKNLNKHFKKVKNKLHKQQKIRNLLNKEIFKIKI